MSCWCSCGCRSATAPGARTPRSAAWAGDWAIAAAGASLRLDGDVIVEAGLGLTAVGAPHFAAAEAADFLRGGPATPERLTEAGTIAAAHCSPTADQRGPADYKRHLVAQLTARALHQAHARRAG